MQTKKGKSDGIITLEQTSNPRSTPNLHTSEYQIKKIIKIKTTENTILFKFIFNLNTKSPQIFICFFELLK